jgi:hypothetical protein
MAAATTPATTPAPSPAVWSESESAEDFAVVDGDAAAPVPEAATEAPLGVTCEG